MRAIEKWFERVWPRNESIPKGDLKKQRARLVARGTDECAGKLRVIAQERVYCGGESAMSCNLGKVCVRFN